MDMDLSRRARIGVGVALAALVFTLAGAGRASAAAPDFGPNVIVFDAVDGAIDNPVDARRDLHTASPERVRHEPLRALLRAGTYGSAASPLDFQVGYYTQVAGLGASRARRDQRGDQRLQPVRAGGNLQRADQLLAVAVEPDAQRRPAELAAGTTRRTRAMPFTRRLRQHRGDVGGLAGRTDAPRDHERHARRCRTTATNNAFASGGFFADDEFNGGRSPLRRSSSSSPATATSTGGATASGTRCSSGQRCARRPTSARHNQYTTLADHAGVRGSRRSSTPDAERQLSVFVPGVRTQLCRARRTRGQPGNVDPDRPVLHRRPHHASRRRSMPRSRGART